MTNPFEVSTANDAARSQTPRPSGMTSVRYVILFLSTAIAVMLYMDRVCISPAGSAIKNDLKLSTDEFDNILSAFFLTYALAQIPSGWLGDRFGARWTLAGYAILWSFTTGLMGFATSGAALLGLRMACGVFQSGAYPVAAGVVRHWVPAHRRGVASSAIAIGGRLGGALAPVVTVQLMLLFTLGTGWASAPSDAAASDSSWRPVMIIYGAVGILLAAAFAWYVRDKPALHPSVGDAELSLIGGESSIDRPVTARANVSWPPMTAIVMSVPLWLNSFVQFSTNLGWAFLVTLMPNYLKDVFNSSLAEQGWLQSLPLIGGILGMLMGGVLTDWLTQRFGGRWGRALAMAASKALVAIAFVMLLWTDSAIGATLCLSLVGLATDLGTPACWAIAQDIGGRHVGSVFGWANMWGNLGAALSPKLFGYIVVAASTVAVGWQTAFLTCAIINVLAAVAGFCINSSRPIDAT